LLCGDLYFFLRDQCFPYLPFLPSFFTRVPTDWAGPRLANSAVRFLDLPCPGRPFPLPLPCALSLRDTLVFFSLQLPCCRISGGSSPVLYLVPSLVFSYTQEPCHQTPFRRRFVVVSYCAKTFSIFICNYSRLFPGRTHLTETPFGSCNRGPPFLFPQFVLSHCLP